MFNRIYNAVLIVMGLSFMIMMGMAAVIYIDWLLIGVGLRESDWMMLTYVLTVIIFTVSAYIVMLFNPDDGLAWTIRDVIRERFRKPPTCLLSV